MVKVIGNADKQETGRWLNNRAENFKPMWQLLGSGYTGLPDERLDASSLGYRNAKKKVSNPLPGVARRERPFADLDWSLGMMRCGPLDGLSPRLQRNVTNKAF